MSIAIDPSTMFLALVAATFAAVLLLLWSYHLNRQARSLLWTAVGFALGCVGVLSMALRESLPAWAYFGVGVASLILGIALIWGAMRIFNGRPVRLWMMAAGPAIWLVSALIPGFVDDFRARMILSSLIIATCYALAAMEIRSVKDGLRTRTVTAMVLAGQSLFVLVRVPFSIIETTPTLPSFVDSSWFAISAFEAAVFVQVMSFLMISLTKERVEQQLRDVALTDSLTGLGNRRAYFDWTAAALARGARADRPVAAVLFDLDRFKEINDRFGHPIGDSVIQAFADAARGRLRAGDFVARLGGEEFAVALPDTTDEQASYVARQINDAFTARVASLGHSGILGTASAGVADSRRGAQSVEELLTAADRALYEAKAEGRGVVRIATPLLPMQRVEAA